MAQINRGNEMIDIGAIKEHALNAVEGVIAIGLINGDICAIKSTWRDGEYVWMLDKNVGYRIDTMKGDQDTIVDLSLQLYRSWENYLDRFDCKKTTCAAVLVDAMLYLTEEFRPVKEAATLMALADQHMSDVDPTVALQAYATRAVALSCLIRAECVDFCKNMSTGVFDDAAKIKASTIMALMRICTDWTLFMAGTTICDLLGKAHAHAYKGVHTVFYGINNLTLKSQK